LQPLIDPIGGDGRGQGGPRLPSAWQDVRLHAGGLATLRVLLTRGEERFRLTAFDETGGVVVTVDALAVRGLESELAHVVRRRSIYRVEWTQYRAPPANDPESRIAILGESGIGDLSAQCYRDLAALVEATKSGVTAPQIVLVDSRLEDSERSPVEASHAVAQETLELMQAWLVVENLRESRLVVLTKAAVAVRGDDGVDLRVAPLLGLLRSAFSEHPGRFASIDTDNSEASHATLDLALCAGAQ